MLFLFFSKLPSKWKGDNSSVSSLCISPDGKMLLSAGRSIKLWDLETKEVYRVRITFFVNKKDC